MESGKDTQNRWEQSGGFHNRQYNAQVQNHYYHGVEKGRTVTNPTSTVPFLRDPSFVERSEFRQLDEKLRAGRSRVALTGLGGVGKSQLAIECCHRMRQRSPECWVFWIHASSTARLDAGVRDLADVLKLPGRNDPNTNMLRLAEDWLRGSGSQWLLVLDNADLEDPLFESLDDDSAAASSDLTKRPIDFLAIPSCGQTILTTRNKGVASRFVDGCDIIALGPMIKSDAITLFQNKTQQHHDRLDADVEELVEELGCVALAVVHAAAFIRSKVPPCPIQEYLAKLRRSIKSDASILTAKFGELRRDPEASNSAIVTWQVSFEHIRQVRPSAADVLSVMSFFDHRSIPRFLLEMQSIIKLLRTCTEWRVEDSAQAAQDAHMDAELDSDILILYEFHLISVVIGSTDLEMHPLVQLSARKWLQLHGKEDDWQRTSIETLLSILPKLTHEALGRDRDVQLWERLYPHIELAFDHDPRSDQSKLCQIYLLDRATTFVALGNLQKALILGRRCWAGMKHHMGNEHPRTLHKGHWLGNILMLLGRYEDSFAVYQELLGVAERQFEFDRSIKGLLAESLIAVGKLAEKLGRLPEAESHLRRALGHTEDSFEDLRRINCVEALAEVLIQQKKYSEAEEVCRQLLALCTERYEAEHIYTMLATKSLANVLAQEGALDEALTMYMQALDVSKRRFGLEEPWSVVIMSELVRLLEQKKMKREAVHLFEQLVEACGGIHGEESPKTLARALKQYKNPDQALDIMRSCAAISRQSPGAGDPNTIKWTQSVFECERELRAADPQTRAVQ